MRFHVGDEVIKVTVSMHRGATPAGGPYTVCETSPWNSDDSPGHELKTDCCAVRVREARYGSELGLVETPYGVGVRTEHEWDCSCDFRLYEPPRPETTPTTTRVPKAVTQ